MKHLKDFPTHTQYAEYIGSNSKILPNVSYCNDNDEMHYNTEKEDKVICVFNVTTAGLKRLMNAGNVSTFFTEIEIDGVVQPTVIGTYTFTKTGKHTVKYTLADPTTFGNSFNNTDMETIEIPNSIRTIGNSAFLGCTTLKSVVLSNRILSVGNQSFYQCSSLESVTVNSLVPPTLGTSAFGNNKQGRKIYVRESSVDLYKNAPNWSEYASDIEVITT